MSLISGTSPASRILSVSVSYIKYENTRKVYPAKDVKIEEQFENKFTEQQLIVHCLGKLNTRHNEGKNIVDTKEYTERSEKTS